MSSHPGPVVLLQLACQLFPVTAIAQDTPPSGHNKRPVLSTMAEADYQSGVAQYKGVNHVLVLPGLVANRNTKQIEVFAEATGIKPGSIVEFLLIDADSSQGYESLLWSHARPGDIHRALQFIGMTPGKPFQPGMLRSWPERERGLTGIGAAGEDDRIPLESLVTDTATDRTLPATGFIFTYSIMVHRPGLPKQTVYAADVMDPRSVASIFNDSTTVPDVPGRAPQHLVYGRQLVAPAYRFKKNERLTITLQPEYRDGRKRVADLSLDVAPATGNSARLPVAFELTGSDGKPLTARQTLPDVLDVFGRLNREGRNPYVSVRFGTSLKLETVRKVCRLLQAIDTDRGIHVEPPADHQLYYEAFLPDTQLLDRQRRIVDPWEIHVRHDEDGCLAADLMLYKAGIVDGQRKSTLVSHTVASGDELRMLLAADAEHRKSAERRRGPSCCWCLSGAM